MKLDTYTTITEDSVMAQIRKLEDSGFYLLDVWHKPSKKQRKALQGRRKAKDMSPHQLEVKRAYWRRGKATLRGKYNHMKWQINKQHPEHEGQFMSFEDWQLLWRKAGTIPLGDGTNKLAWKARGRDEGGGWAKEPQRPQLRRWNLDKPYTLENVYVAYKAGVLADGETLAEQFLNDDEFS